MRASISIRSLLTLLALTVLVVGCSGISYNSDFDPEVSFAELQTFDWLEAADPAAVNRGIDSEILERRIKRIVAEELEARGYKKGTAPDVDFLVNFYGATQEKIDVNTYNTGWGYRGWYGGTSVDVRQWTEGTLIIDVVVAKSMEMVWRGWAQGSIDKNATPEQREQKINKVVSGILDKFPPDA